MRLHGGEGNTFVEDTWNPTIYWNDELDALECDDTYLVDNILVAGQLCLIAGPEKCLKTSIMVALAVSVASGKKFLGKYDVLETGKIGIVSCESGPGSLKGLQRRVIESHGIEDFHERKRIAWSFQSMNLQNPKHIQSLRSWIVNEDLSVVMIDPVYMMLPSIGGDAKDVFAMGPIIDSLREVASDTGCAIVVAHHFHKLPQDKATAIPELHMASMAGWREGARQWILLNRREKFDPTTPGVHKLWMTAGGSAGHCEGLALDVDEGRIRDGRKWDVQVRSIHDAKVAWAEAKDAREESKQRERADKVLGALEDHPDGLTKTAILRIVKGDKGILKETLEYLDSIGEIEQAKVTMSGKEQIVWRLA